MANLEIQHTKKARLAPGKGLGTWPYGRELERSIRWQGQCIFTIDVEEWFHILDIPSRPSHPVASCVERNFIVLLDLLSEAKVSATCFFLGCIAEQYPHLVQEATDRGHEVASHGYGHELVYTMNASQFYDDVARSKEVIERASGRRVLGYRCPGFSCTESTPWFFEELLRAGYRYDSSVFPQRGSHGGVCDAPLFPHVIEQSAGKIIEVPMTVAQMLGKQLCCFGGGYLRLAPLTLIVAAVRQVLREGRPVVLYVHPREIDPSHPRLTMSPLRYFKSYVNLKTTSSKLRRLTTEFPSSTLEEYLAAAPGMRELLKPT